MRLAVESVVVGPVVRAVTARSGPMNAAGLIPTNYRKRETRRVLSLSPHCTHTTALRLKQPLSVKVAMIKKHDKLVKDN